MASFGYSIAQKKGKAKVSYLNKKIYAKDGFWSDLRI